MLSFTIILLLPFLATLVAAQRIFINQVPAYSSLPTCAEVPLSFIVRDMASGCGDGSKTTSYSCFCTDRSSKMNSIISTAVASRCSTGPISAATEAVEVFASYCGLGNAKYGEPREPAMIRLKRRANTAMSVFSKCQYNTGGYGPGLRYCYGHSNPDTECVDDTAGADCTQSYTVKRCRKT